MAAASVLEGVASALKPMTARCAHYVIRNSDLLAGTKFFDQVFGMKVIRHEENAEPCDITCNGRYNNAWSKTMVGYKTEDIAYCLEVRSRIMRWHHIHSRILRRQQTRPQ